MLLDEINEESPIKNTTHSILIYAVLKHICFDRSDNGGRESRRIQGSLVIVYVCNRSVVYDPLRTLAHGLIVYKGVMEKPS